MYFKHKWSCEIDFKAFAMYYKKIVKSVSPISEMCKGRKIVKVAACTSAAPLFESHAIPLAN